jgi:altronate dehydratase
LIAAQQCGGSDAFSGTCANPLVGAASKLLIQRGGSAVLAETDELIGAEAYVLSSVSDLITARRFVAKIKEFHTYAHAHGATAEGNPSGGNLFRGLYNIALKSLGAATKRHPDVRLERVLDYAEPVLMPPAHEFAPAPKLSGLAEVKGGGGAAVARTAGSASLPSSLKSGEAADDGNTGGEPNDNTGREPDGNTGGEPDGNTGGELHRGPGYCFMDSPGNDLESIAGQVASGCNLIYFTTGSG